MAAQQQLTSLKQRIRRTFVVGLALIAYLAGAVGFPVPASVHKPAAVAFPCQNHACGCMTAEQCWQQCCCFSHDEKMAWAQANKVQPPPAPAQDAGGWNVPRRRDREQKASCCAGHGASCADVEANRSAPAGQAAERSTRWVVGVQAQQCRGLGNLWLGGEPVSVPPPLVAWRYDPGPVCWLQASSQRMVSMLLVPPTPPPRG